MCEIVTVSLEMSFLETIIVITISELQLFRKLVSFEIQILPSSKSTKFKKKKINAFCPHWLLNFTRIDEYDSHFSNSYIYFVVFKIIEFLGLEGILKII